MLISLNFAWKGTILHTLQAGKSYKTYSFRIKVGYVQMAYFQEVVSYTFLLWAIPVMKKNMCPIM
jgi:hypothetical protein